MLPMNTELEGIWDHVSNRDGPCIIAKQNAFNISRDELNAFNQWTMLSIQQEYVPHGGIVIAFKVKFDFVRVSLQLILTPY